MGIVPQRKFVKTFILTLVMEHVHNPCSFLDVDLTPYLDQCSDLRQLLGQHLAAQLYIRLTEEGEPHLLDYRSLDAAQLEKWVAVAKHSQEYEEHSVKGLYRRKNAPALERRLRGLGVLAEGEHLPNSFHLCCELRLYQNTKLPVNYLELSDGRTLAPTCQGHVLTHLFKLLHKCKAKNLLRHFELAENYELKPGVKVHCNYCGHEMQVYDHHFRRIKELYADKGEVRGYWLRLPRALCCDKDTRKESHGRPIEIHSCCECQRRKKKHLTMMLIPEFIIPFLCFSAEVIQDGISWLRSAGGKCKERLTLKYKAAGCKELFKEIVDDLGKSWLHHYEVIKSCLEDALLPGLARHKYDKITKQPGEHSRYCAEDRIWPERYLKQGLRRLYIILLNKNILPFSTYYLYPMRQRPF